MVREQAAADQVEAAICEGKCERIGHDCVVSVAAMKVRAQAIEVKNFDCDPLVLQLRTCGFRDFPKSGGYFEDGEMFFPGNGSGALDQLAGGGDSSEPAVDAAQVSQ